MEEERMKETDKLREKQLSSVNGGLEGPAEKRQDSTGLLYIHKKEPGGNEEILRRRDEEA